MKTPPENFEALQRLLAMKRHEQPPPRFFSDFADRVLTRLASPEPLAPLTWRQRLGLDIDLKPALVCVWGVGLCGALAFGLIASLQIVDAEPQRAGSPSWDALELSASPVAAHPHGFEENSDPVSDFRNVTASVNYYASSPLGF